MEEIGRILQALQELDRQYARSLRERSAAPGQERRDELAAEAEREIQREKEEQSRVHRVRTALKAAELDLGTVEERLAKTEKRLYGGTVSNPKELAQLQQRLQEDRVTRSNLEDDILKLMDEAELLDRRHQAAVAGVQQAADNLASFEAGLAERAAEESQADERYRENRQALLGQLPEQYRVRYERIQENHPGSALATIERGHCSGCHTTLAQAEIERAARQPGLTTCESCGRMLWPVSSGGVRT